MGKDFPLRQAFIALPLENDARERFRTIQNSLSEYEDIFRFQNPETAHLTLYFWNELMEIEYVDVVRKMEKIAKRMSSFTLHVSGMQTFVDAKTKLDRVLWFAIDRSEELATLKKLCPWPNIRPFSPHITIARIGKPHDFRIHKKKIMKLLREVTFDIPIDRVRFFAEVEGAKQNPLQDFRFRF